MGILSRFKRVNAVMIGAALVLGQSVSALALDAFTVTNMTPTSGTLNTTVTFTGTGFDATTNFSFGAVNCVNLVIVSSTQATCTPPFTFGASQVTVTPNRNGVATSNTFTFTYVTAEPLTLSSVSPTSFDTLGFTRVTLNGTGFADDATVTVDNATCRNVTVISSTQLTCLVPSGTAGTKTLKVTVPSNNNSSATASISYTSTPGPSVTAVSPASGSADGGTTITVTGTNFMVDSRVTIGSSAACTNVVVSSPTSLTCVTPTGQSGISKNVYVTNNTGTGTGTTFLYSPPATAITSTTPASFDMLGFTQITVNGAGFANDAAVTVDNAVCRSVTVVSSSKLTCIVPGGTAGTKTLKVSVPSNNNGSATSRISYVSTPAPTLTSITPSSGPILGGTLVTIVGTNFKIDSDVQFGDGSRCTEIVVASPTSLTCKTPAGSSGSVAGVFVSNNTGTGTGITFSYDKNGPTISSTAPNIFDVSGTATITITGTNFASGSKVTIDGVDCTNVTVLSATQITCKVPVGTVGSKALKVTVPSGSSTLTATTQVIYVASLKPAVSSIAPNNGPASGGTPISISGTNFSSSSTVTVGGAPCASVSVASESSLKCVTPAGAAGNAKVIVTNDNGASDAATFTYTAVAPTITSASPAQIDPSVNTPIEITGTDFATGAIVNISGIPCQNVVVVSPTKITCTTVASTAGDKLLTVTNPSSNSSLQATLKVSYVAVVKMLKTFRLAFPLGNAAAASANATSLTGYLAASTPADLSAFRVTKIAGMAANKTDFAKLVVKLLTAATAQSTYKTMHLTQFQPAFGNLAIDKTFHPLVAGIKTASVVLYFEYR